MNNKNEYVKYSFKEELANAISHWAGFLFGIAGLIILLFFGVKNHDKIKIVGFSIYGGCLILMYLCSALYHSIQTQKIKSILRVFDHSSIFLFIAGSYTPIILLTLSGAFKITILSLVWGITFFGVGFKIFTYGKFNKYNKISLILYLGLGWISVLLIKPILLQTSIKFVVFLVTGGLLYSVGVFFYANKKILYNHAIWHLFVLAASVSHYLGLLFTFAI